MFNMLGFITSHAFALVMGLFILLVCFILAFIVVLCLLFQKEHKINQVRHDAELANKAKNEFLSRMSHDIRTPLNGIIGMTEIARMEPDNIQRTKECLDDISQSSNHLVSLINDVLNMSLMESGKHVVARDSIDLRSLIDSSLSILSGLMAGRDIKLDVNQGSIDEPFVFSDELMLRQILVNILSNAVKFTPNGGSISISIKCLPHPTEARTTFVYTVQDTGIGMSREFVKRIFEPFSQERADARTEYHGTGLGMSLAKQYTESLKGKISVESTLGVGTQVVLSIPLEIDRASGGSDIEGSGIVVPVEKTNFQDSHVLLVEDNLLNRKIAKAFLEKIGMIVDTAENGLEGVEKFASSEVRFYDVILMDIMMPVMDGYEATKAIRELDRFDSKTVPIIALSANVFADDIQNALHAGMNSHIAKPVDVNTMMSVIGKFLK